MAASNQETEVVPAEEPEEMPLPSDPKVIFLGGLFVLALLAAASVASFDTLWQALLPAGLYIGFL